MDSGLLVIIFASSIIFVALIVWKVIWFYKKIIQAELLEEESKSD